MPTTDFWKRTTITALLVFATIGQIGCGGSGASSNTSAAATSATAASDLIPSLQTYATPTGTISTDSSTGSIDPSGVFFQQLGTHGRTCATCHQLSQGMSINAANAKALFTSTSGGDPLFDAVDGANCPNATTGDASAHSLMLDKALIRIPIELPKGAQFTIVAIQDPYGCSITTDVTTGQQIVSIYRRPLPAASLPYMSNIMWDTRETIDPLDTASTFAANLNADLTAQAVNAIAAHMQGTVTPTTTQETAILALEEGLFTAEATDTLAGSLSSSGATGGAAILATQNYYPGINDAFGQDPRGAKFNPAIFGLYQAWANSGNQQQASIARGQGIFNTAPMTITGVRGLNDNPALGSPAVLHGSCGTCHDTPNVGNHSLPLPMDTGTSHLAASETAPPIVAGLAQLAPPNVPIYQITGCTDANNNPVVYTTTDPGTGLFSGLCADVNRFKIPVLRGLAARAPYFHNGSADNLDELLNFYNARFQMNLNAQQVTDLVNFLNAL